MSKRNGVTVADRKLYERLADSYRIGYGGANPGDKLETVSCWHQGAFTIVRAVMKTPRGRTYELMGAAKRDCGSDPINHHERGRAIALARALKGEAVEVS